MENEIIIKDSGEVQNYMDFNSDNILMLAEQAEKRINAIKKIMKASLSVTNENDWCLIGGKPYLQEAGAGKIARLFGISWKIDKPEVLIDSQGYKTYIFKGVFTMNNDSIEAEGSRSMKDDFFTGKGDKKKSIDEIDERDVRMSAYTNCINNGIKRIIPGIRNLKLEDLEQAGLETKSISGYTFKTGSQGGTQPTKAESSGIVCECCGASVTQRVASYSQGQFGRILCMACQKNPQPPKEETDPILGE
jgi:hypothetical protein